MTRLCGSPPQSLGLNAQVFPVKAYQHGHGQACISSFSLKGDTQGWQCMTVRNMHLLSIITSQHAHHCGSTTNRHHSFPCSMGWCMTNQTGQASTTAWYLYGFRTSSVIPHQPPVVTHPQAVSCPGVPDAEGLIKAPADLQ